MSSRSSREGGSVSGVETEAAAWCRPAGTAANSPGKPIPWNTLGSPQCIATVAIIAIVIKSCSCSECLMSNQSLCHYYSPELELASSFHWKPNDGPALPNP